MDIWQESLDVEDYVVRCYRHLHENPELSDREEETVSDLLRDVMVIHYMEAVVSEDLLHLFRPDCIFAGIFHKIQGSFA